MSGSSSMPDESTIYVEQLELNAPSSFTSLKDFLRGRFQKLRIPRYPAVESTTFAILECHDETVQCREISIPVGGRVSGEFEAFIAWREPASVKPLLRMVFWQTDTISSINPAYLNFLAQKYRLAPEYLSAHLEKACHYLRVPTANFELSIPPPSKRLFLHVVRDVNNFMSLVWAHSSDDIETSRRFPHLCRYLRLI